MRIWASLLSSLSLQGMNKGQVSKSLLRSLMTIKCRRFHGSPEHLPGIMREDVKGFTEKTLDLTLKGGVGIWQKD